MKRKLIKKVAKKTATPKLPIHTEIYELIGDLAILSRKITNKRGKQTIKAQYNKCSSQLSKVMKTLMKIYK